MRAIALIALLFVQLVASAAAAQSAGRSDAILDALQVDLLLEVLQAEAVEAGGDLAEGMMPGRATSGWSRTLRRINDPARTGALLRGRFAETLDGAEAAAILDFLATPLGGRIVALELSAREALQDPEIEAAVLARYRDMRQADDPRVALLEAFIVSNDLIDANVAGALNANAAFLNGMRAAADGARALPYAEGDIAAEVWRQEPELRGETEDWVRAFVALAYQPLTDDEMAAYLAFSETPAGQALNAALFDAFDAVFVATSYETGEALGRWMNSEEL